MSAGTIIAGALGGWVTLGVAALALWPAAPPTAPPYLSPYQQAIQHCRSAGILTRHFVGYGGAALEAEEYARCLADRLAQLPAGVRP